MNTPQNLKKKRDAEFLNAMSGSAYVFLKSGQDLASADTSGPPSVVPQHFPFPCTFRMLYYMI